MAGTKSQLKSLADSLSKFKPDQAVEWQVGKIANALIEQAKQEEPNSVVLKTIDPLAPDLSGEYIDGMRAGAVRTVIQQAAEALPTRIAIG